MKSLISTLALLGVSPPKGAPPRFEFDPDKLDRRRLRGFQEKVDELTAEAEAAARRDGVGKTCLGLGCNACCHGKIPVSKVELAGLLPYVDESAWVRVRAIRKTMKKVKRYPCPLLDPETGGCSVYPHWPLVCRSFSVSSPPVQCATPTETPVRSIMHTSVLELLQGLGARGRHAPLADLLIKAERKRHKRSR